MNSPGLLLIELDGTPYLEGEQIPDAGRAFSELREMGSYLPFLGNTDSNL